MFRIENHWYIAAAGNELRDRPIRRSVEGETLVLFRDSSGKPHALIDRCGHRGMALSRGRVVGDCIECPYHGWQYDGEGALHAVPALCDGETQPMLKTMVRFPVAESDEHLWVWIGREIPEDTPLHFPHCGERGWATFFMHTRFEAPVEACLENFLDVPHTLFVHPGLFRGSQPQATRVRVRRTSNWAEAEFLNEQPLKGIGPRLLFPKNTLLRHTDRFILPSMTRVDYQFGEDYRFVITSQCTQRAESVVDVTTAITWRLPLPSWLTRPLLRWYCRKVIQQDVDLLAVLGEQTKQFGTKYVSTSADVLGSHIRGLRHQAAEQFPRSNGREVCTETLLRI